MANNVRRQGANALGVGLLCWAVNIALVLTVGLYGPILVILGALGIFFGAVLLIWGDSYRSMPLAQKIPAALITLAVVGGGAASLLQWTRTLSH